MYLTMDPHHGPMSRQKLPNFVGGRWTLSNKWYIGLARPTASNGISIESATFVGFMVVSNRHKPTHATN